MSNILQFEFEKDLYSFNPEGWFNATEAAQRFGKEPGEWLRLPSTAQYRAGLTRRYGKIPDVRTSRARADRGGGTWLHPKLAVRFAQWLDVDFAIWCDEQIDAIIRNGVRAEGNVNLIALLLRPDAAHWEQRFQPDYYHALARVTGTTYTGHAGGTPTIYASITDRWVYGALLPADVHAELKARRGDSTKMHQWLTDGGRELLDRQIATVRDMASSSADMRDFEARMMAVSQRAGQLGFIYPRAA